MAHPKHEDVRQRYNYACGYCGITETDAGGELTVDHYVPTFAGGSDELDNLIYACVRCNLYKSKYLPNAAAAYPDERILHPLQDKREEHFRADAQTGLLEPLTETGRFHIALLHLNRPALIASRRRRTRELLMQQLYEQALRDNAEQRALIEILLRLILFQNRS